MPFTEEQQRAIDAQGRVIVSASAGSGKTTVMIEKIIRLILSGVGVEQILAVTFTKKAAAQMKEKLCKALIKAINDKDTTLEQRAMLKRQLAGVPTADISTIHSYCSKLIKTHFFAAGVDSGFKVIGSEDADGRALKNQALDELLEEGYEAQDEGFSHLLSCYWRKKKDAALRTVFDKTYAALRDRADYREYLSFVRKGYTAEEFDGVCADLLALWQERCRYYYELVEDEYAYFLSVEHLSKNQIALCKELMDWLTDYGLCKDYFAAARIEKPAFTQNRNAKNDPEEKKEHAARLGFLKDRIVDGYNKEFSKLLSREEERENFLVSGKTAAALAAYLLRFDEKYEARKTERGVLDYNDLEHKALALLKDPEVAKETQEKYRYVFVDEYQDVNPVQEELISRLSADNLFLVGDVKQSIYGFRGSKSRFFVEKQGQFEGGEGRSLFMKKNFRSTDAVLDAVNAQFALAMTPKVCDVDYARDSTMEKGGRYALNSGKVSVYFVPDEEKGKQMERGVYSVRENAEVEEKTPSSTAQAIANIIKEELNGTLAEGRRVQYSDIAILTRKNAGAIEEEVGALTDLGIPVTTASAVNVCEFSEVKALIDILSLLDNAEQDIPLCSALLSGMGKLTADDLADIRLAYKGYPFRAACKKYAAEQGDGLAGKLTAFYAYFHALRTEACVLSAGEVLAKILADTQMEAGLLSRKSGIACLKRIRRFIEEAGTFEGYSVHDFLEHLRNLDYKIEYSENGGEDSVKVMTMHSSKGLEFPIVILANLNQPFRGGDVLDVYVEEKYGLAPRAFDGEKMLRFSTLLRRLHEVKEAQSSRSDELNLYYVALTRAEQRLHLIFSERTTMADVRYARSFAEFTNFSVWKEYEVEEDFSALEKGERQTLLEGADEGAVHAILQAFHWQYTHSGYENLPVKSSPTQLMEGGKYLPERHFTEYGKEDEEMEECDRELSVREGTAYHAFLEHFDFSLLTDEKGERVSKPVLLELVEGALHALAGKVEVELLSKEQLVEILSNGVFYGLQGRLYKEQQFLVSLPVKDTYAKKEADFSGKEEGEEMIFQGAIDLLCVSEEGARIIDYKYSKRGAEELKTHYKPQLDLYKLAVARVLKMDPSTIRCSIVNICRGFQVDVE